MLVRHERPRDVRWYLAGPMFFGDIGTSRLYVLGLALYFAGTAAPFYVACICALLTAVGWAYTIVCRVYPDGGGVYSSGRSLSPTLGVLGATLLFANYIVTASISTYEAIIYIGSPFGLAREHAPWLSVVALGLIGTLNWVGSRRAGTFALIVAVASVALTAVIAAVGLPHLPDGWQRMSAPTGGPAHVWTTFVAVVLALSGVESIANMTGIMVHPVEKTARRAIWPVIAEVVVLNLVLIVVALGLPQIANLGVLSDKGPAGLTEFEYAVKEKVLYVVASAYLGRAFAAAASIVFGLLLLSATNTAVVGMVSIQYAMSRDGELPEHFSRINFYGVPWYGLILACLLPAIVCLLAGDLQTLAELYAIGVVGAIAINLGSCAYNRALPIAMPQRIGLWFLAMFMGAIWVTIAATKIPAVVFISLVVGGAMLLRTLARVVVPPVPVPAPAVAAPAVAAPAVAIPSFDPSRGRVLVASRGNRRLVRFAFEEAKQRGANLFLLFVRELAVLFPGTQRELRPEEDHEASSLFADARQMASEYQVPLELIYCVSTDPADVILDFAATYAADLVVLGVSRRGILRALRGDVISTVADNLPQESTLLIHA